MKNTNKQLKIGALALMTGLYSAGAMAVNTVNGTGTVEILEPISVTLTTGLDFGTIAAGSALTTVSVNAAGTVSAPLGTGNALVTVSAGSALVFDVQGTAGQSYVLTMVGGILDDAGTGAAMNITITGDDRPATLTGGGTADTVTATASIDVPADQVGGTYTTALGTGAPVVITANYQ
jgi:hypothetical protein